MSGVNLVALRLIFVALMALSVALPARAQCNPPEVEFGKIPKIPSPKSTQEEPLLPEAGFLSDGHYTNQFFGFGFDLPLTVKGHEIMLPLMPEKEHALLALQFEDGRRKGYIMVTAYDPAPGADVKTPEKEAELRRWAQTNNQPGAALQIPVPAFMLRSNHFYHQIRRQGHDYMAQYWTSLNNYNVKVMIGTNDADFLRKSKNVMANAQFYCPQDDGTLTTEDGKPVKIEGKPYSGPTAPTFRVNAALRDRPGKNISPGTVSGRVYRNPDIGFQYEMPEGWAAITSDNADPPIEPTSLREYQFLHACSRTLLYAAPQHQGSPDGSPGTEIVLRALDPNCLSMRAPTSLTEKRAADEVAAFLEQLGEFGEIASDELVSVSDHLFMVFHGTIANAPRSTELGQRLTQSIFATRYNKLLLIWSVMAPTSAALGELPTGSISFANSPSLHLPSKRGRN